jgi:hypothetical protein
VSETEHPKEKSDYPSPFPPNAENTGGPGSPRQGKIAYHNIEKAKQFCRRWVARPTVCIIQWIDRHDGIVTAAATVAIACLTWSLAQDSSRQAETAKAQFKVMKGQLDEMKNQRLLTVAQLSANLRRENISMQPIGENGKIIGDGERINGWNVNPVWTNVGSTDARNVSNWFEISIQARPAPVNGNISVDCPKFSAPEKLSREAIVARERAYPVDSGSSICSGCTGLMG